MGRQSELSRTQFVPKTCPNQSPEGIDSPITKLASKNVLKTCVYGTLVAIAQHTAGRSFRMKACSLGKRFRRYDRIPRTQSAPLLSTESVRIRTVPMLRPPNS